MTKRVLVIGLALGTLLIGCIMSVMGEVQVGTSVSPVAYLPLGMSRVKPTSTPDWWESMAWLWIGNDLRSSLRLSIYEVHTLHRLTPPVLVDTHDIPQSPPDRYWGGLGVPWGRLAQGCYDVKIEAKGYRTYIGWQCFNRGPGLWIIFSSEDPRDGDLACVSTRMEVE